MSERYDRRSSKVRVLSSRISGISLKNLLISSLQSGLYFGFQNSAREWKNNFLSNKTVDRSMVRRTLTLPNLSQDQEEVHRVGVSAESDYDLVF